MLLYRTLISFLKDEGYRDLLLTTSIVVAFGSIVYHYIEGWDWIDAIYFSVITLTTVGYGDLSPQTDEGKIFTIFYITVGIGIILSFINTIYNHYATIKSNGKSSNENEDMILEEIDL